MSQALSKGMGDTSMARSLFHDEHDEAEVPGPSKVLPWLAGCWVSLPVQSGQSQGGEIGYLVILQVAEVACNESHRHCAQGKLRQT